jgi:hypothetical protein
LRATGTKSQSKAPASVRGQAAGTPQVCPRDPVELLLNKEHCDDSPRQNISCHHTMALPPPASHAAHMCHNQWSIMTHHRPCSRAEVDLMAHRGGTRIDRAKTRTCKHLRGARPAEPVVCGEGKGQAGGGERGQGFKGLKVTVAPRSCGGWPSLRIGVHCELNEFHCQRRHLHLRPSMRVCCVCLCLCVCARAHACACGQGEQHLLTCVQADGRKRHAV